MFRACTLLFRPLFFLQLPPVEYHSYAVYAEVQQQASMCVCMCLFASTSHFILLLCFLFSLLLSLALTLFFVFLDLRWLPLCCTVATSASWPGLLSFCRLASATDYNQVACHLHLLLSLHSLLVPPSLLLLLSFMFVVFLRSFSAFCYVNLRFAVFLLNSSFK